MAKTKKDPEFEAGIASQIADMNARTIEEIRERIRTVDQRRNGYRRNYLRAVPKKYHVYFSFAIDKALQKGRSTFDVLTGPKSPFKNERGLRKEATRLSGIWTGNFTVTVQSVPNGDVELDSDFEVTIRVVD